MRPRRYRLIGASLVVHAAVVIALFIAGFWNLDRLDSPRHTIDIAVPGPPPPAPAGGPEVAKAEPFKQKQQRKVIKELVQPKEIDIDQKPTPTASKNEGSGSGDNKGPGDGSGSPTDKGPCTQDCGPSDDNKPEPEKKKVVETEIPVIPSVIRGMRISGETQIQPPENEKTALIRSGKPRANATAKVCVGPTGSVTSLSLYKSSGYAGWDAAIIGAMRNWRYKPHLIDGRAVLVCGMVTFLYEIK
jgi:periplasmic protein TonB